MISRLVHSLTTLLCLCPRSPNYCETALYGRKWMNRFLLHLASMKGVVQAPADADLKTNRFAAGQKLISDEIQRLLTGFLLREKAAAQYRHTERDEVLHGKFAALVMELLSGLIKMDADHLKDMAWIDSVLLGTCIQSKNEEIRMAVQKLVQRTSPTPNPYPVPVKPQPPAEVKAAPEVGSTSTSDGECHAAPPAPTETELAVENSGVVQEETSSAAISDFAVPDASYPEESPVNALAAVASTSADTDDSPAVQELTTAPSDEGVDASLKNDSLPPTNESDAPEVSSASKPAPAESWNPMSWFSGGSSSPRTSATAPSDPPPIEPSLTDEELEAKGESEAPAASDAAVEPYDTPSEADNPNDEKSSDAIPPDEGSRADELIVD
jgi:hypothetical protein